MDETIDEMIVRLAERPQAVAKKARMQMEGCVRLQWCGASDRTRNCGSAKMREGQTC